MIRKCWYNFIYSGQTPTKDNIHDIAKLTFLNIFSVLSIIFNLILVTINIVKTTYLFIPRNSIAIILLLLLIIFLRIFKTARYISIIFIIVTFLSLLYVQIDPSIKGGMYLIFLFPLVVFFLSGKYKGLIWIGIFILISGLLQILLLINIIPGGYALHEVSQAFLVFCVVTFITLFYEDIRTKNEILIINQLFTDNLTKLPNRTRMIDDLKSMDTPKMFLLNIDRFKEINDFYGTQFGDFILTELANRLREWLPNKNCHLYKLHADEYAIIINMDVKKKTIEEMIFNLLHIIYKPFIFELQEIRVKMSFGIALEKENIIEKADMALKHAKLKMKNYIFYDSTMKIKKEYENNLRWTKIIEDAIANDRVIPYFQPIVNNKTNQIEKYECLARLLDENENVVSPTYFIPIAKKAKIYLFITRLMFIKSILKFIDNDYEFSINISMQDICDEDIVTTIKVYLEDNEVARRVVFEILETEGIQNFEPVSEFIDSMKKLGCKIAIDDFGTGYSNFGYIIKLNVDYIKIDASLIKNIHTDKNSLVIVKNIVNVCKELKIKTIAEYVESKQVLNKVVELGIDYSQGYYIGKPAPTLEVEL